jgi:hypothetical protein
MTTPPDYTLIRPRGAVFISTVTLVAAIVITVYLPDEMRLIKAEAFTNLGTLDSAAFYVNAVRTQASSSLDEPVADLPALDPATDLDTAAELLAQIAYERRYELYMQGLRWEDTRRLGESVTTTPVFSFLPTPQQECNANPNAGC